MLDALARHLAGSVILAQHNSYESAAQMHFTEFDAIRPAAVAMCKSVEDVRRCIAFAQHHGIHSAVRSGGHSFAGFSTTEGLVIDLSQLDWVNVAPRATLLSPGAQYVDILHHMWPYGATTASGRCPTVCAGGYLLAGGIGWTSRKFGLAVDRLVSATVVLADSSVVQCTEAQEPELFWALRGAGSGSYGVVTEFEIEHLSLRRMVNYWITWPWDAAADVVSAWQTWIVEGSDDLGSELGIDTLDVAGREPPKVAVFGGWLGDTQTLRSHLAALVASVGRRPHASTVRDASYLDAMMDWFRCTGKTLRQCHRVGRNDEADMPRDKYFVHRSTLMSSALPSQGLESLLAAFMSDPQPNESRYLGLFAVGGQTNRVPRNATAYVHRTSEFVFNCSAGLPTERTADAETAAVAWATNCYNLARPFSNGETYQNFVDRRLDNWQQAYYAENYPRLVAAKRRYDPHDFFHHQQSIRTYQ